MWLLSIILPQHYFPDQTSAHIQNKHVHANDENSQKPFVFWRVLLMEIGACVTLKHISIFINEKVELVRLVPNKYI